MKFSEIFTQLFPFITLLKSQSVFFFFSTNCHFHNNDQNECSFYFQKLSTLFTSFFVDNVDNFQEIFYFSSFFRFFNVDKLKTTFFHFFAFLLPFLHFISFFHSFLFLPLLPSSECMIFRHILHVKAVSKDLREGPWNGCCFPLL